MVVLLIFFYSGIVCVLNSVDTPGCYFGEISISKREFSFPCSIVADTSVVIHRYIPNVFSLINFTSY